MFKRLLAALIEGRQKKANYEIAKILKTEYPEETLEYIITRIEGGLLK